MTSSQFAKLLPGIIRRINATHPNANLTIAAAVDALYAPDSHPIKQALLSEIKLFQQQAKQPK